MKSKLEHILSRAAEIFIGLSMFVGGVIAGIMVLPLALIVQIFDSVDKYMEDESTTPT